MPTKPKPLISIIVPAYNEEDFLADCLKSLCNQDFDKAKYEIVVVDNASTDKTVSIAKKFPVKLISEPKKSVVLARQAGFVKTIGSIIVSADADTTYPPNWLSRIAARFVKDKKLVALAGWIYFRDTSTWFNLSFALSQQFNAFLQKRTGKFPFTYAANFAFRRWALEKIGGYPKHLPELGDQQYLLQNFLKLGKVVVDKRVFCTTSARRHKEPAKDVIVYNGWYRLIGYAVNRLSGRQIIGPAPAVRGEQSRRRG
jgi:glycosyltransferase involved in cell wall biosynthesis